MCGIHTGVKGCVGSVCVNVYILYMTYFKIFTPIKKKILTDYVRSFKHCLIFNLCIGSSMAHAVAVIQVRTFTVRQLMMKVGICIAC